MQISTRRDGFGSTFQKSVNEDMNLCINLESPQP